MRWRGREESENVRDVRGMGGGGVIAGGGIGVLLLAFLAYVFGGGDAAQKILENNKAKQQQAQRQGGGGGGGAKGPIDDDAKKFIGVVLNDTENVWAKLFRDNGVRYEEPELIIFSGGVTSGCGKASSDMGPFYCPADKRVYIDPSFFADLAKRHKAPGDFAQAFVIAHEVGHHIQNLLKWNANANAARRSGNKLASNRASVRLELQADFLAGVWAHHAHKNWGILERGDLKEAMRAAIQIGDDTLQAQATGRVIPANFTHGSGEQRQRWFMAGVESGNFREAQRLIDENAIPYNEL